MSQKALPNQMLKRLLAVAELLQQAKNTEQKKKQQPTQQKGEKNDGPQT